MRRTMLTVTVLAAIAAPAFGELKIENVEASHGQFGPARESLVYVPYDEVFFRYQVAGATVGADGKIDCVVKLRLTDADGKVLLDKPSPLKGVLSLGGGTFPGNARVTLTTKQKPGPYKLSVAVEDKLGGGKAAVEREFVLKPPAFAIVNARFAYDKAGKASSPVGGLTGQVLHFGLRVVGFDKSKKRIDAEMNVQVFDARGNGMMPKPIRAVLRNNDAATVAKAPFLTFSGSLVLNRAGAYQMRITVTDKVGNQTTTFTAPLTVRRP